MMKDVHCKKMRLFYFKIVKDIFGGPPDLYEPEKKKKSLDLTWFEDCQTDQFEKMGAQKQKMRFLDVKT